MKKFILESNWGTPQWLRPLLERVFRVIDDWNAHRFDDSGWPVRDWAATEEDG